MSGHSDDRERGTTPLSDAERRRLKDRLDALDSRLEQARDARRPKPGAGRSSAIGKAFRMANDLIAAVVVGAALGWGLDYLVGWGAPWGMIVMTMVGFAAGIRSMVRTAEGMQAAAVAEHGLGRDIGDDPDGDRDTRQ